MAIWVVLNINVVIITKTGTIWTVAMNCSTKGNNRKLQLFVYCENERMIIEPVATVWIPVYTCVSSKGMTCNCLYYCECTAFVITQIVEFRSLKAMICSSIKPLNSRSYHYSDKHWLHKFSLFFSCQSFGVAKNCFTKWLEHCELFFHDIKFFLKRFFE